MKMIKAAFHYFALIFALGFVLGTIRTLLVLPATGPLVAVLLELPIMIAASWLAAAYTVRRHVIAPVSTGRLAMGAFAFVLLMTAEVLLGLGLGRPMSAQISDLATPHGLLGFSGQALFGLMPLILLHSKS